MRVCVRLSVCPSVCVSNDFKNMSSSPLLPASYGTVLLVFISICTNFSTTILYRRTGTAEDPHDCGSSPFPSRTAHRGASHGKQANNTNFVSTCNPPNQSSGSKRSARHSLTGWARNSTLNAVKTMLISVVIREKKQRLGAVRGVHCID